MLGPFGKAARSGADLARRELQLRRALARVASVDQSSQRALALQYRQIARHSPADLPTFRDVGFRVFSQTDEDGLLHFIFSLVGTTNRRAIEICAGDGIECTTANLTIVHGWSSLLVDGSPENVEMGRRFYARCPDTYVHPPTFVHAWIDRENVNRLIESAGFGGDADLLCVDLDGMDYWVWEAIDAVSPRVVVVEYQNVWGPERAVTVPYRADFRRRDLHPDYCGASLAALVKLADRKGYRLVGCNRFCFNGFFVRRGIGERELPEISPDDCFDHPHARHAIEQRQPVVRGYEWVSV